MTDNSTHTVLLNTLKQNQDIATKECAAVLDSKDTLARFRDEFLFPQTSDKARVRAPASHTVYLCGNSLGLQPKRTNKYVQEELEKWAKHGVEGHFESPRPWVTIDETVIDSMAKIVGALPVEVSVMNSLTTNLHLMMVAFYQPQGQRRKILIEKKAFPSDYHAVCSQIKFHGYDPAECLLEATPREGEDCLRTEDVVELIEKEGDEIALVLLTGIQYYTGQLFDMKRITEAARAKGCRIGLDLAHAVGNVPLKLHEWGPDFACWCTYKYLNSGPGSIGGCFVHERHAHDTTLPRFAGWWGHRKDDRFKMAPEFIPSPGAFGFQLSNPPVLPLAALRASLDIFMEAGGMDALREKSLGLTLYLEELLKVKLPSVKIITPQDPQSRGSQLSLVFPVNVKAVYERLQEEGVVVDIREPNAMRVAPCPLYNNYSDVFEFVNTLVVVLKELSVSA